MRVGSPTHGAAWSRNLQAADGYFDEGADEFRFAWDDRDAGIPWPRDFPILSERDRSNLSLIEALERAPTFSP